MNYKIKTALKIIVAAFLLYFIYEVAFNWEAQVKAFKQGKADAAAGRPPQQSP